MKYLQYAVVTWYMSSKVNLDLMKTFQLSIADIVLLFYNHVKVILMIRKHNSRDSSGLWRVKKKEDPILKCECIFRSTTTEFSIKVIFTVKLMTCYNTVQYYQILRAFVVIWIQK